MRILFDQGTPAPLRQSLAAHNVSTAYEMGWSTLANGDLLDAAEAQFDVFVTTDQTLRHQQNLVGRRLAILDASVALCWVILLKGFDLVVCSTTLSLPLTRLHLITLGGTRDRDSGLGLRDPSAGGSRSSTPRT